MSASEIPPGLGLSYATDALLDLTESKRAHVASRHKAIKAALTAAAAALVVGAAILLLMSL